MEEVQTASRATDISIDIIDTDVLNTYVQSIRKELARHRIALWFIWAYLILLTVTLVVPTVLYLIPKPSGTSITELKDLLQAFSGALTGLTGILGFVVGYYFKGEELTSRNKNGK